MHGISQAGMKLYSDRNSLSSLTETPLTGAFSQFPRRGFWRLRTVSSPLMSSSRCQMWAAMLCILCVLWKEGCGQGWLEILPERWG